MGVSKIKCLECGVIIESHSRWDFKKCGCPNETMVDGGDDYLRYGGRDMCKVKVLNGEEV